MADIKTLTSWHLYTVYSHVRALLIGVWLQPASAPATYPEDLCGLARNGQFVNSVSVISKH